MPQVLQKKEQTSYHYTLRTKIKIPTGKRHAAVQACKIYQIRKKRKDQTNTQPIPRDKNINCEDQNKKCTETAVGT